MDYLYSTTLLEISMNIEKYFKNNNINSLVEDDIITILKMLPKNSID